MPSPEASRANLEKANAPGVNRPIRPWRSEQESWLIRHFVWQWLTYLDSRKWSMRCVACWLNVSHVWIIKLVRRFVRDPQERARMVRDEQEFGLATHERLEKARRLTQEMRVRGLLRPSWPGKYVKVSDPYYSLSAYWQEQMQKGKRLPKRAWRKQAICPKPKTRAPRIPQDIPIWATSVYSICANRWRAR